MDGWMIQLFYFSQEGSQIIIIIRHPNTKNTPIRGQTEWGIPRTIMVPKRVPYLGLKYNVVS